jgi:cytochrome b
LLTLSVIDFEGPLLFLANLVSDQTSYAIRHLHEFLTTVALVLVALHLLGVVSGSIQHKENLVRAMVTGNKEVPKNQDEEH